MSSSVPKIDVDLVKRLIASQFPAWAELAIKPVAHGGWDNRTFHLGDRMSVRLPSATHYAEQVEKEHQWLPKLAPLLHLPIPSPLAKGEPAQGYPFPWSVYRWIEGETAQHGKFQDADSIAAALAKFLIAYQSLDVRGGPPPGAHNFHRGAPLAVYAQGARDAIAALANRIDQASTTAVLEAALESTWQHKPVWVHGDVAAGNLLLDERGCLSAVIDFGCMAVGDPACDLAIAWTFFTGKSRDVFRSALPLDKPTWARARGWTLWKALITLARTPADSHPRALENSRVVTEVIADHQASA